MGFILLRIFIQRGEPIKITVEPNLFILKGYFELKTMIKLSNIFLLIGLFVFGLIPSSNGLLAQNKETGAKAEISYSKTRAYLNANNLDSAFASSRDLLEFATAENLPSYQAKAKMILGEYFRKIGKPDSSLFYLNKAAIFFSSINDTLNLGKTFLSEGFGFRDIGEPDSTLKYFLQANNLFTSWNDTVWLGITNNIIGNHYSRTGNYPLAIIHLQKSLEAEKLLGSKVNIGANYNSMGTVYRKTNNKKKEEDAYINAIQTLEQVNKTVYLGEAYNNLSEIYFDKGETEKAFETLEKAREVFEEIDYPLGVCSYYSVLGYYYSTTKPPDNPKVIENFTKSISIAEQYGDYRQYADGTSYLGTAYLEIGQLQKARIILEKGLAAARKNGLAPETVKISKILAEVYSRSGQSGKAYQLLQQHLVLKDSLSGEDKIKEFTQLDLQYKFRQQQISDSLKNVQWKMQKDIEHAKELRNEQNSKFIFLSISILLIIIAIFIFVNSRKKKKLIKILSQKNITIINQKTEIELSAKKVDKAYSKLKELDEYKQSMTQMLVHDLKNPLNLLVNLDGIEGENEKDLVINRASHQMLNLVMNLLDISKAEDNRMELHKAGENLLTVFESAVKEVEFLRNHKNVKVIVKAVPNYSIYADREVLTRVFVNFLTNAIKYSPVNGEVIYNVELTTENHLRVTIKDHGKGIPKKFHEIIFEKFKQVEQVNSGVVKSTGLGLAFCKLAAESHGWKIGVDSEPGKGAGFWIEMNEFKKLSEYVEDQVKTNDKMEEFKFTKHDAAILKPYIDKLATLNVFLLSEIEDILSAIKKEKIKGVEKWADNVAIATQNLNEAEYNRLITFFSVQK